MKVQYLASILVGIFCLNTDVMGEGKAISVSPPLTFDRRVPPPPPITKIPPLAPRLLFLEMF